MWNCGLDTAVLWQRWSLFVTTSWTWRCPSGFCRRTWRVCRASRIWQVERGRAAAATRSPWGLAYCQHDKRQHPSHATNKDTYVVTYVVTRSETQTDVTRTEQKLYSGWPKWRQPYKTYDRSQQQKHTFSIHKNKLMLHKVFSTLYKSIFRLLMNVIYAEWMHTNLEYSQ